MERSSHHMIPISSSPVSEQEERLEHIANALAVGRHVEAGLIPGHTPEQLEAIQVLEDTAQRLSLHMVLAVGDIQFVADSEFPRPPDSLAEISAHVFHARTAYTDFAPPRPRRHLLRLWLSTPVKDGGWKRPFPDGDEVKRGGIQVSLLLLLRSSLMGQVDQRPERCPLDAE